MVRDRVRQSRHNRFESVHRLGGWAALGILAVIVPVEAARSLPPGSGPAGLLRQPSVLLLATLVLLVAHPCLVIRRAGDWTERLARDVEHGRAPARLWVRRIRGYGFMYHAQAYRRVLMVATGAGIGPVLQRCGAGQRGPGVRGAGRALVRPDLRLLANRRDSGRPFLREDLT